MRERHEANNLPEIVHRHSTCRLSCSSNNLLTSHHVLAFLMQAYGVVWKAIEKRTRQVLALKKCFDAFRNATDAQRTFREIMYLQALAGHDNLIRLQHVVKAENGRDIYLTFDHMGEDSAMLFIIWSPYILCGQNMPGVCLLSMLAGNVRTYFPCDQTFCSLASLPYIDRWVPRRTATCPSHGRADRSSCIQRRNAV